ncbi:DUF2199 domain-containing protein [Phycisphaeraceae bacterium D3-23]
MNWCCKSCGETHRDPPLCFACAPPWLGMVPEDEFDQRVILTDDVCIVDNQHFFLRGHIALPILEFGDPLCFSAWVSLSQASMERVTARWDDADRASDSPYFGWLCSEVPCYPSTMHLKTSVQSELPGRVSRITLEPTDHPFSRDQADGITIDRWHAIAHQLLHATP